MGISQRWLGIFVVRCTWKRTQTSGVLQDEKRKTTPVLQSVLRKKPNIHLSAAPSHSHLALARVTHFNHVSIPVRKSDCPRHSTFPILSYVSKTSLHIYHIPYSLCVLFPNHRPAPSLNYHTIAIYHFHHTAYFNKQHDCISRNYFLHFVLSNCSQRSQISDFQELC